MTRVLLSPFITYCPNTRGPCNNKYYLGHVKNVCDDDDDDTLQPMLERLTNLWSSSLAVFDDVDQEASMKRSACYMTRVVSGAGSNETHSSPDLYLVAVNTNYMSVRYTVVFQL